jgi:hypothetical protein
MEGYSEMEITRAPVKALKGHELFLSEVKQNMKSSEKLLKDEIDKKFNITETVVSCF